ncbi:MAG: glycoside hydrolase family 5 protein [Holophagaceae bacterium]|nr:glycoside hydrolase family 5 protein [Holophagaceae bacterium]
MRIFTSFLLFLFLFSPLGASQPKAVVFFADGFPAIDTPAPSKTTLEHALRDSKPALKASWATDINSLVAEMSDSSCSLLVLPYGSAFPVEAWPSIKNFLGRGGNLLVIGGAPFHQPVRYEKGRWVLGFRQPTFANQLLIGPAEEIAVKPGWSNDNGNILTIKSSTTRAWSLTVRFASTKDFAEEDGGAGIREAILRPLARLVDGEGIPRVCLIQEIDRLRGNWAGGRWVFATTDAGIDVELAKQLINRAVAGPYEFEARVLPASLEQGEKPRVRMFLRRPLRGEDKPMKVHFTLLDEAGNTKSELTKELSGSVSLRTADAVFDTAKPLPPGHYTIVAKLLGTSYQVEDAVTGVWVKDTKLLQTGPRLTASRDWLRCDGKPMPVVGTTYMDSQIHRKFLFEPNPARWNADFATMRKAGINYVRTGLWTGWPRISLEPGSIDENVLRALDAYIQCAANNDIHVCFTFFAFLPSAVKGDNPYLHPRSLETQKALLTLIASRYKGSPWIHYDLINEPSYSTPAQLWSCRPIGDIYERSAWREYLTNRYGNNPAVIADIFRDGGDPFNLPNTRDFGYASFRQDRAPRKAAEFYRFANEVVANWAADLRQTIQQAGGDVMVTLGQDEGGIASRPGPAFFGSAVDYTTVHSWWNNDDLLWDSLAVKLPDKPCLSQETGMMRLEDIDGKPWRGIAGSAELLERKFAMSFLGRGAGAVQWAWNINTDMDNDNEVVIGLFRADGTAKPEYDVIASFGKFAKDISPYLDDWDRDEIAVLIPHQRIWLGRPRADEGARRIVKLLADRLGVAGRLVSDQTCKPGDLDGIKLVIVPTIEYMNASTELALKQVMDSGGLVLVFGPIEGNFEGRPLSVLTDLDKGGVRPLFNREYTLDEGVIWSTFDQNISQSLRAGIPTFDFRDCQKSNLWHEGLPLDYAREEVALFNLITSALGQVGINTRVQIRYLPDPVISRVLKSDRAYLIGASNESLDKTFRKFTVGKYGIYIPVKPGRSAFLLIDPNTGKVLATYNPPELD